MSAERNFSQPRLFRQKKQTFQKTGPAINDVVVPLCVVSKNRIKQSDYKNTLQQVTTDIHFSTYSRKEKHLWCNFVGSIFGNY